MTIDAIDTVTLDVPLFIRMMELAREDLKSDAELHEVVTRLLKASKEKDVLTMNDYNDIIAAKQTARIAARLQEKADGPIVLKPWQMKIYRTLKQLSLRLRVQRSTTADKLIMITDQVTAVPLNLIPLMRQEDIVLHVKAESSQVVVLTFHRLARI